MDMELEKNIFKFTEKILYGYKDIEEFISNTEEKIKLMDQEELTTEIKALDRVEEEVELKIELYRNKKLKREIDRVISNLSTTHKELINLRYIECLDWMQIVERMNYEERQLRNKKNEAVKSIARKLFGAKVFREDEPTLFDMLDI